MGKKWFDFIIVSFAFILDYQYKLMFVLWSYNKMYDTNSSEIVRIYFVLSSLLVEYKHDFEQLYLSKDKADSTSLEEHNWDV